jgi:hypothetical protein
MTIFPNGLLPDFCGRSAHFDWFAPTDIQPGPPNGQLSRAEFTNLASALEVQNCQIVGTNPGRMSVRQQGE